MLDEAKRLREEARVEARAETPVVLEAPLPQAQRKQDAQARQQLAARAKPLKRELEQADKRMAELNSEKVALETRMGTRLPPAELAVCGRQLKAINDELDALEERWLALSGDLEAIETAREGS